MTIDAYMQAVADAIPGRLPDRAHILDDVRAHIAERVQGGGSADAVIASLGDPIRLAERYLAEITLAPAPFWPRAVAKIIDIGIVFAGVAVFILLAFVTHLLWICVFAPLYAIGVLLAYAISGEAGTGQTPGKSTMHLLVIRETGTRISVGQALVRQLPWVLQVFWIDAAFALFTDRHQRAFELLSKTRTVEIAAASTVTAATHAAAR